MSPPPSLFCFVLLCFVLFLLALLCPRSPQGALRTHYTRAPSAPAKSTTTSSPSVHSIHPPTTHRPQKNSLKNRSRNQVTQVKVRMVRARVGVEVGHGAGAAAAAAAAPDPARRRCRCCCRCCCFRSPSVRRSFAAVRCSLAAACRRCLPLRLPLPLLLSSLSLLTPPLCVAGLRDAVVVAVLSRRRALPPLCPPLGVQVPLLSHCWSCAPPAVLSWMYTRGLLATPSRDAALTSAEERAHRGADTEMVVA